MTQHWYYSRTGCDGTGMCCERRWWLGEEMYGVWSSETKRTWREVVKEDCQACILNTEDAMGHSKLRKLKKDVRWSGWVWVGECFLWYQPTRVDANKRPLNGCVCVEYRLIHALYFTLYLNRTRQMIFIQAGDRLKRYSLREVWLTDKHWTGLSSHLLPTHPGAYKIPGPRVHCILSFPLLDATANKIAQHCD